MTDSEKISMLKVMQEEQDESVLSTYLFLAGQKITLKMYGTDAAGKEVPPQYDAVQLEIAVYLLGKRGAEGEIAHTENGVSRTWGGADVPDAMLACVTPYARVHG